MGLVNVVCEGAFQYRWNGSERESVSGDIVAGSQLCGLGAAMTKTERRKAKQALRQAERALGRARGLTAGEAGRQARMKVDGVTKRA